MNIKMQEHTLAFFLCCYQKVDNKNRYECIFEIRKYPDFLSISVEKNRLL